MASSHNCSLKGTLHLWGWDLIQILMYNLTPSSWNTISRKHGVLSSCIKRVPYFASSFQVAFRQTLQTVWLCGLMLASRWIRVGKTELSPGPNPCCVVSAWQLTCLPLFLMLWCLPFALNFLIGRVAWPIAQSVQKCSIHLICVWFPVSLFLAKLNICFPIIVKQSTGLFSNLIVILWF